MKKKEKKKNKELRETIGKIVWINISYSNIITRLDTVEGTIDRGVGAKSRTGFVGRGRGNRSTCERAMPRISTNPR